MQLRFAPAGVEHGIGIGLGQLRRAGRELADIAQQRLHLPVDRRRLDVIHQRFEHRGFDPEMFGRHGVVVIAVGAGVDPGSVGSDQLAIGNAERSGTAHQCLAELTPQLVDLGERRLDVLELGAVIAQRRKERCHLCLPGVGGLSVGWSSSLALTLLLASFTCRTTSGTSMVSTSPFSTMVVPSTITRSTSSPFAACRGI